jgi:putative ABC transport system permease protein
LSIDGLSIDDWAGWSDPAGLLLLEYPRAVVEAIVRDLRFAGRGLRRTPGFSAAAILTIAIGVGATTAVFSVVYGVLLRRLPFPTADRLVRIVQLLPSRTGGEPGRVGLTPGQIAEWSATSHTLAEIGSFGSTAYSLTGVRTPVRLNGAGISVALFRATGVAPALGRTFTNDDELPGNERVVVLEHGTWVRRFGGSPEVVERTIFLDAKPYRVIGVMPEGFGFPSQAYPGMSLSAEGELKDAPEFWIPMLKIPRPAGPETGGFSLLPTFALLAPGVTLEQATAEVNTLMPARAGQRWRVELVSAHVEQTRKVRRVLLIFQTAVLFVLFIACANVTNLLLARAAARQRELLVRIAIGASRADIARHAILESSIIGVCGGVAGCAGAALSVALVRRLPPYVLPRLPEIHVDATVFAFAFAVAAGAGLAVGLWSAARLWRSHASDATAWRGAGGSAGRLHRPSRLLVIAETAAGVTLLAGAALLLGSFVRMTNVDRGLDARGVYSFRVAVPPRIREPLAQYAFHDALTVTLRSIPGVTSVAAVERSLDSTSIGFDLTVGGARRRDNISFQSVSPDFFATLRIPLRGRDFTGRDRSATATTAIVSETFARRYFPTGDAVGQPIAFNVWPNLTIIGVAGDTRPGSLDRAVYPTIYLPTQTKNGFGSPTYLVRAERDAGLPAEIRAATARVEADAVVFDATPLDDLIARQVATPKFYGYTATGFAAIAVLLAALGLYGVLSYSVSTRTREFGIRIAVGATARRVIGGVMRQAVLTVLVGVAIGLAVAFWSARFLEALLFGVRPNDPATLASVAALFLAVALLAAYVPARRATRVDPVTALRAE